jgi:hypothetical protein
VTSEGQGSEAIPEDIRLQVRIAAIFAPYAARQQGALIEKRTRLRTLEVESVFRTFPFGGEGAIARLL